MQQRLGRQFCRELDEDRATRALNWMESGQAQPALGKGGSHSFSSSSQRRCLEHIRSAVAALGPPPDGMTPAEALSQLRATSGVYDLEKAALGNYDPSLVSSPAGPEAPVPLARLWGDGGSERVELFCDSHVLDADTRKMRLESCQVKVPYADPKLRSHRVWAEFIKDLYSRGLIDFSRDDGERCDIFFVQKKNGMLRMVIDCRRSNMAFDLPDSVRLATGDAFSSLELECDCDDLLTISGVDLKDAFLPFRVARGAPAVFHPSAGDCRLRRFHVS